jgi:hypothetical protein
MNPAIVLEFQRACILARAHLALRRKRASLSLSLSLSLSRGRAGNSAEREQTHRIFPLTAEHFKRLAFRCDPRGWITSSIAVRSTAQPAEVTIVIPRLGYAK